jgi:hypothetical protein
MLIMFSNCVLPYVELLAFAFPFEILKMFLCLLLVPFARFVTRLNAQQTKIPFAKIFIQIETAGYT